MELPYKSSFAAIASYLSFPLSDFPREIQDLKVRRLLNTSQIVLPPELDYEEVYYGDYDIVPYQEIDKEGKDAFLFNLVTLGDPALSMTKFIIEISSPEWLNKYYTLRELLCDCLATKEHTELFRYLLSLFDTPEELSTLESYVLETQKIGNFGVHKILPFFEYLGIV